MGMQGNGKGHHPIYFFYLLGMKFKNMRELKKFKSKNKYDDDENDDQSESSFSGRNNFCCNKCCHYYFIPRHFEICEERREENRKN